jgi:hypothetical protein
MPYVPAVSFLTTDLERDRTLSLDLDVNLREAIRQLSCELRMEEGGELNVLLGLHLNASSPEEHSQLYNSKHEWRFCSLFGIELHH